MIKTVATCLSSSSAQTSLMQGHREHLHLEVRRETWHQKSKWKNQSKYKERSGYLNVGAMKSEHSKRQPSGWRQEWLLVPVLNILQDTARVHDAEPRFSSPSPFKLQERTSTGWMFKGEKGFFLPGIIVFAPYVYSLVHIAIWGSVLARSLHRSQRRQSSFQIRR